MKRILLVDDDAYLLFGLVAALRKAGYNAWFAESGEQGLKLARDLKPLVILCDIIMPGMNGFQFIQKVQQDETIKHIPVIFISGREGKDDIDTGLRLGAKDYLVKPVRFNDLLQRLDGLMNGK